MFKRIKLIVFEGVSGTGKETQAKLLSEYLAEQSINAQIVFHPTPEMKDILTAWRRCAISIILRKHICFWLTAMIACDRLYSLYL